MTKHPAPYSKTVMDVLRNLTYSHWMILDPMAGIGRIHELPGQTVGIELEHEWASQHPRTIVGNALALPFRDELFDAVITSPCLAHGQRILRDDLLWVPVEEIEVGERLLAFDEFGVGENSLGRKLRRKWRHAEVLRSFPDSVECVMVHLSNGESVVCTPEHPWLAGRYQSGASSIVGGTRWLQTKDLLSPTTYCRRVHGKWVEDIPKKSTGWWVYKQLNTWTPGTSYTHGWLAGMFDGEGSLSFGTHGAPKLVLSQLEGEVGDLIQTRLKECGYDFNLIPRTKVSGRQPMLNVYITGGFPGLLHCLGELRPNRLIGKLDKLNVASRCLQPIEKVQVLAIEPVGKQDIQVIETSTGTYIGEGYLMHNCYGNRMADHHNAQDGSHRRTYKHYLGRDLHPENSGQMQWGADYRVFHLMAWREAMRVLRSGGWFYLNVSDHVRKGEVQPVTNWHLEAARMVGFRLHDDLPIKTPRYRFGANPQRATSEHLLVFSKERNRI